MRAPLPLRYTLAAALAGVLTWATHTTSAMSTFLTMLGITWFWVTYAAVRDHRDRKRISDAELSEMWLRRQ